ncbi:hypothetical protein FS749_006898 [Ceratobasidium sp. UAMH 11750]|nr:hypothetical protein FS749_006898 [Ceratobasidium sp. UAMH 11750]
MISKGWLRSQGPETLQGLGLVDDRSFDWRGFHDLGESSGDEADGTGGMEEDVSGVVGMVGGMGVEYGAPQAEIGGMQAQQQAAQQHVGHMQHVPHVQYGQPQGHMG